MKLRSHSLAAMVREQAKNAPTRPALMVPPAKGADSKDHQTLTYQEFWSNIQSYAAFLQSLGLTKGDRIVILSENCAEWIYAHYAGMSLGVIIVPIYPTLPADQA
ncbi:MAG: AMP-binding protein, partial [Armatimonadota bacterium]